MAVCRVESNESCTFILRALRDMTPGWVDNPTISLDWLLGSEAIKKDFPNANIIRCHYHFFDSMKVRLNKLPNMHILMGTLHDMWDALCKCSCEVVQRYLSYGLGHCSHGTCREMESKREQEILLCQVSDGRAEIEKCNRNGRNTLFLKQCRKKQIQECAS